MRAADTPPTEKGIPFFPLPGQSIEMVAEIGRPSADADVLLVNRAELPAKVELRSQVEVQLLTPKRPASSIRLPKRDASKQTIRRQSGRSAAHERWAIVAIAPTKTIRVKNGARASSGSYLSWSSLMVIWGPIELHLNGKIEPLVAVNRRRFHVIPTFRSPKSWIPPPQRTWLRVRRKCREASPPGEGAAGGRKSTGSSGDL
jgi:hypothetical protein